MEIKCQLDATEVFIADLNACSTCFGHQYGHHQELKSVIRWLLPVVFRAVVFKLPVWYGAEGYVSGLQDAAIRCAIKTSVASSWHFISTYYVCKCLMEQQVSTLLIAHNVANHILYGT